MPLCHDPQHGDDGERQCERDEERHVMVMVEFVDYHKHIDVAEWNETKGKDAQGVVALNELNALLYLDAVWYGEVLLRKIY